MLRLSQNAGDPKGPLGNLYCIMLQPDSRVPPLQDSEVVVFEKLLDHGLFHDGPSLQLALDPLLIHEVMICFLEHENP